MNTAKYGLIGKTLKHSFSKDFFEKYFLKKSIQANYENIELDNISALQDFLKKEIFQFKGLNVTIPYKETVLPFLDSLTEEAQEIGAVNTIQVIDNKLVGHNTDAFGFHQSIKPFLTNRHEKALILGTGGVSKAVTFVLKKIGLDVLYVSRSKTGELIFSYEAINEHMIQACKCIINTTPVGMYPQENETIDIPYLYLTPDHLVIDLIYNPTETLFLKNANIQGAMTLNGLSMLKEQAMEAWRFWNDEQY